MSNRWRGRWRVAGATVALLLCTALVATPAAFAYGHVWEQYVASTTRMYDQDGQGYNRWHEGDAHIDTSLDTGGANTVCSKGLDRNGSVHEFICSSGQPWTYEGYNCLNVDTWGYAYWGSGTTQRPLVGHWSNSGGC